MARERDLPGWLAAVHPRYRVTHHAEIAVAVAVCGLLLVVDLLSAIGFSSFGVLVYYSIANIAALTQPSGQRRYPRGLQILGVIGCVTLVATLPGTAVILGVALIAAGLITAARGWLHGTDRPDSDPAHSSQVDDATGAAQSDQAAGLAHRGLDEPTLDANLYARTVNMVRSYQFSRMTEVSGLAWMVLMFSGVMEAGWALSLKASAGFTRLLPTVAFFVLIIASMAGLMFALRTLPVGPAYAVWVGIGAVLTAVIGIIAFRDPVTILTIGSIVLIIAGVVGLQVAGSGH